MKQDTDLSVLSESGTEESRQRAGILVVDADDSSDNQLAVEATLRQFGRDLAWATSGQEAFRILCGRYFAVILLNVCAPAIDGYETAEAIRKQPGSQHTPIICIASPDTHPAQITRGCALGGVDFVFRPYRPELLKAKVGILLDLFEKSEVLRASEERLRTLIVHFPGALYRRKAEPPWDLVFLGEHIQKLTGFPACEFVERRRSYQSIIHPEDVKGFVETMGKAVQDGVAYSVEYRIIGLDKRVTWILDQSLGVPRCSPKAGFWDGFLLERTARQVGEEALRDVLRCSIETQDEERRQIAMTLQHSTAPMLATLTGRLYALRHRNRTLDAATSKLLDDSLKLVDDTSHFISEISHRLHPPFLDSSGLLTALRWYLSGFIERTGIPVEMHFPDFLTRLSRDAEIALFRVAQESLAKILGRAGSPAIAVRIAVEAGEVVLEVSDQGRGMIRSGAKGWESPYKPADVEFMRMRERLRRLGGDLEIAASGSQTTVTATVSLHAGAYKAAS